MTIRRILHIQPGTDGGTERFFVTLCEEFSKHGIEQAFAIRPGRLWRSSIDVLGQINEGYFLRRTPSGLFAMLQLRQTVRDFKPDVVFAWRAPAARLVPRNISAAKIVRLGDYPRHVRHFAGLDAVVCNNPSIADCIKGLGWAGCAPVISNFSRRVSVTPISRAEMNTPQEAFVVCGVGRFTRVKGFDLLIAAVAKLETVYLWLVGDGPELDALIRQVKELGVSSRVRFAGWQADPTRLMGAADAFVLPSRDEPLGNALIEAWQVGLPSVASNTDGPNWYATNECDALIFPIGDVNAIAAALHRLMNDTKLRTSLTNGARLKLSQKFDRDVVVGTYLELFSKIKRGLA